MIQHLDVWLLDMCLDFVWKDTRFPGPALNKGLSEDCPLLELALCLALEVVVYCIFWGGEGRPHWLFPKLGYMVVFLGAALHKMDSMRGPSSHLAQPCSLTWSF